MTKYAQEPEVQKYHSPCATPHSMKHHSQPLEYQCSDLAGTGPGEPDVLCLHHNVSGVTHCIFQVQNKCELKRQFLTPLHIWIILTLFYLHIATTMRLTSRLFPFTYYSYIKLVQNKMSPTACASWTWLGLACGSQLLRCSGILVSGCYNTAIIKSKVYKLKISYDENWRSQVLETSLSNYLTGFYCLYMVDLMVGPWVSLPNSMSGDFTLEGRPR